VEEDDFGGDEVGDATGGGTTLRERVAPHSAREEPFGQHRLSVQ